MKKILLCAILIFTSLSINAQVELAGWNFSTLTGGNGNFGPSPLTPSTLNANVTVVGLTRGSGIITSGVAEAAVWGGSVFEGTDLTSAISINDFVTFTIKANAGYVINLSSISAYNIRRLSTGPTTGQWQYSLNGTSFTNIGGAITWGNTTNALGNAQSAIDLSTISALQNVSSTTTITFRVVTWGGSAGGSWYLNDLSNSTTSDFLIKGTTGFAQPTTSSIFTSISESGSNVTINWINGNGSNRIVAIKAGSLVSFVPTDGTAYSFNGNFSIAPIQSDLSRVVFSGPTSNVTVAGLNPLTTYHIAIYEFNGTGTSSNYLPTAGTGNFTTSGALPVELTSFTSTSNGNAITLNWATATEVENYGFEVERSADNSTFTKVGFVAGAGNSNSSKKYFFVDENLTNGTYCYRLKQVDTDGSFDYSQVVSSSINEVPATFSLEQNYPNPFNPSTKISFNLASDANVKLAVFNALGEQVAILVNSSLTAGSHSVDFNASNLNSGLYFYQIQADDFTAVKKMNLVK